MNFFVLCLHCCFYPHMPRDSVSPKFKKNIQKKNLNLYCCCNFTKLLVLDITYCVFEYCEFYGRINGWRSNSNIIVSRYYYRIMPITTLKKGNFLAGYSYQYCYSFDMTDLLHSENFLRLMQYICVICVFQIPFRPFGCYSRSLHTGIWISLNT